MTVDIQQNIRRRFTEPLRDNYKRRIVFWYDPDGEFADVVDTLDLGAVKVLRLTGSNNFEAKMLLCHDDTDSDYLVYNPLPYACGKDDWLWDVELYSEEFRADRVSMQMNDLGASNTPALRMAVKRYGKFLASKDRVAALLALGSNYTTADRLDIDVLAVIVGAYANTIHSVVAAVLSAGLEVADNKAIADVRKYGCEDVLWRKVSAFCGYDYHGETSLGELANTVFVTAFSATVCGCLHGLERYVKDAHKQDCYSLVSEWARKQDNDKLHGLVATVEQQLGLPDKFANVDLNRLAEGEVFDCIDECVLQRFMTEVADGIVKADEILAVVQKRRTKPSYMLWKDYYDGLLQVAQMQMFATTHSDGFHEVSYQQMWQHYCADYYQMDTYYRQFHTLFGKCLREQANDLEDLFMGVADYVERLYKNRFLAELGAKWTSLVEDEAVTGMQLNGLPQQTDFYRNRIKPLAANGRVFVVVSDALRYEVGVELYQQLNAESRGNAKITAVKSTFPSVTKFGMAALLPHRNLQLTSCCDVLCDGMSTEGTVNRERILQQANSKSMAITYKIFKSMKRDELSDTVGKNNVVYIYHNAIDAVGDKLDTEQKVFAACCQAVAELKSLVKKIVNDLNGTNVIITADHGFVYTYKELAESDNASKSFVDGNVAELDRRYVIADNDAVADNMLTIPLVDYGTDLCGFTPREYVRIRKQGGGNNYVHGGISLQECVVPVVEYKNVRSSSRNYVDRRRAELQLISLTRKVSNNYFVLEFHQKQPVGGKVVAATYDVYLADKQGTPVSDIQTIIADKTDADDTKRVFRVRFALKNVPFSKTDIYYLTVTDKVSGSVVQQTEFFVDITFVDDFAF